MYCVYGVYSYSCQASPGIVQDDHGLADRGCAQYHLPITLLATSQGHIVINQERYPWGSVADAYRVLSDLQSNLRIFKCRLSMTSYTLRKMPII